MAASENQQMKDLVAELIDQQTRIFELLEFDERPLPRAAAGDESLSAIDEWFAARGGWTPPSYREFLRVCDGVENFCVSYHLLGTSDLSTDAYEELSATVLEHWIGYDHDLEFPPILIGHDPETTTRVFLDFFHEQMREGEPVVFEGDPGNMTVHPSFGEFLTSRVETNRLTIRHLEELTANPPQG